MMSLRSGLQEMKLAQLDLVQIASPCDVAWDAMQGNDKVRFCPYCQLKVYNLSAMDVEEAAETISRDDDRLCLRFYRRADGAVMTQDCPKSVERKHESRRGLVNSAAGLVGAAVVGSFFMPFQGAYARPAARKASLLSAAKSGNVLWLTRDLDGGCNVDWATDTGVTPLMFAAAGGHVEAVRLLLSRGAHVNARDAEGRTALTRAKDSAYAAAKTQQRSFQRVIALLTRAGGAE